MKVKLTKLLWCVFILFLVVFLTGTLSARFLIKSVKSDRAVKVHFQVQAILEQVDANLQLHPNS